MEQFIFWVAKGVTSAFLYRYGTHFLMSYVCVYLVFLLKLFMMSCMTFSCHVSQTLAAVCLTVYVTTCAKSIFTCRVMYHWSSLRFTGVSFQTRAKSLVSPCPLTFLSAPLLPNVSTSHPRVFSDRNPIHT